MPQGVVNSANAEQLEAELAAQVDRASAVSCWIWGGLTTFPAQGCAWCCWWPSKLRQVQGELALCELKPHVREVFEISGFL